MPTEVAPDGWSGIVAALERRRDLDGWARECGALKRSRRIKDGAGLLRLALVYGACGLSLRRTCLWAASEGVADLSNEALIKRLVKAAPWLQAIAAALLEEGAGPPVPADGLPALRIVDGTTLSPPGARAPAWRLLITVDPRRQTTLGLHLQPARLGEQLEPAAVAAGTLVLADRGLARPAGLRAVRARGADFLVRLGTRSLRLFDAGGARLTTQALLAHAERTGGLDGPVHVGGKRGEARLPARVVLVRLPEAAGQANAARLRRAGQREGYAPSPLAFAASGWLMLLTSLPAERAPAAALARTYRLRWQVELAIKRLKSLGHLDRLPARNPDLARAWIWANLIAAVLTERWMLQVLGAPPSRPARPPPPGQPLEAVG